MVILAIFTYKEKITMVGMVPYDGTFYSGTTHTTQNTSKLIVTYLYFTYKFLRKHGTIVKRTTGTMVPEISKVS